MAEQIYDFPPMIRGDWWYGISKVTVTLNGSPMDLTAGTVRMTMRPQNDRATKTLELVSGSGITILDAEEGEFEVIGRNMDFETGVYAYDIEVTLADSRKHTVLLGTITLAEDVTKP